MGGQLALDMKLFQENLVLMMTFLNEDFESINTYEPVIERKETTQTNQRKLKAKLANTPRPIAPPLSKH